MAGPSGVTYACTLLVRRKKKIRQETYLGHPAIYNKVAAVDKAALITSQKHYRMRLLNSLAKTPSREMDLATVPLGLVIT